MQHQDYAHIMAILTKSQSIFVKQLLDLYAKILVELEKANDNIDYLQILVDPCRALNHVKDIPDVPPRLKQIINLMRVIWTRSMYFNNREHISSLFRSLSNQVIMFCQSKIDVPGVLNGKPREGLHVASLAIDCCLAYRLIYDHLKEFHMARNHPVGWDLDEAAIFNHVNAFVQRLEDLTEICNAMIVFGRIDETVQIPSPKFGGIRGIEFEETCLVLEQKFISGLVDVRNAGTHLMDVHKIEWYDDAAKYRLVVRELEEIVENLISNVFVSVSNVEEGLEALCSLYYFSKRANLRPAYLRKTSEVWNRFSDEIEHTNKMLLEQVSSRQEWMPRYAGRAVVLKMNMDRITRVKLLFDKAEWLPENTNSTKAMAAFDQMQTSITKNVKEMYIQWLETMNSDIQQVLNRTLMCRSVTRPGMLECNIDRRVMELCEESRYFEMLGFSIPIHVRMVYGKYATLRLVYETVMCVVLDYNRILVSLSDKERQLFKALITACERRIMPGLTKLTWGGEMIDAYIADCEKYTAQVRSKTTPFLSID